MSQAFPLGRWRERDSMSQRKAGSGFAAMAYEPTEPMSYYEVLDIFSEGDGLVEGTLVDGIAFGSEDANGTDFKRCVFRNCLFESTHLVDSTFHDVRFEGCRFINSAMDKTWLNRVDFADCSAPGLSLVQARLAGVSMRGCGLSYANLSAASVERPRLTGTRLREAALQRARLKHVVLKGCDLTHLDVFGTRLAGIDLSSCVFQAPVLSSNLHELRGALISPEQEIDLAALLGVEVVKV